MLATLLLLPGFLGPVETRLDVDARYVWLMEGNLPNPLPTALPDTEDRYLEGLYLGVGGLLALGSRIELTTLVDTQLLTVEDHEILASGRPLAEEAEATAFLREARLALWLPGGLVLRGGKSRFRVGEGLILDAFGTGADLELALSDFSLQIGILWPGYDLVPPSDPLLHGRAEYQLDLTRRLFVFATWDTPDAAPGGGNLRALISAAFPRLPGLAACVGLRGHSERLYVGAGLDFLLEEQWITAVALLQRGQARVDVYNRQPGSCPYAVLADPIPVVDEPVSGFALDGTWRVRVNARFFPGLFGTWLSGDEEPGQDGWTVFSPPAALLGHTLVFFGAGATTPLLDQTVELAGLEARGVRAFGFTALYAQSVGLEIDGVMAFLWPDAGPGFYGIEYDLRLRARPGDDWRIQLEAGVLDEGDFFKGPMDWWLVSLVMGWVKSW